MVKRDKSECPSLTLLRSKRYQVIYDYDERFLLYTASLREIKHKMINIKQFAELQKKSKKSFANQRQVMKKVIAGQEVLCPTCQQPLYLLTPEQCTTSNNKNSGIRCKKGCTDIQLDFT